MSLSFRDTYDNFYRFNCISVLLCSNSEEWEDMGTGFNEVHEAVTGHCWSWDMDTWGFIALYVWGQNSMKRKQAEGWYIQSYRVFT